eukprot:169802-Prorocentrum_minimum.AAC.2
MRRACARAGTGGLGRAHLDVLAREATGAVLERLADVAQVAADVEEFLRVGVEVLQHGRLACAQFQILHDDQHQPLHLLPVRRVSGWFPGALDVSTTLQLKRANRTCWRRVS